MTITDHTGLSIPERTRALHAVRIAGWVMTERLPGIPILSDATLFRTAATPRGELTGLTPAGEQAAELELAAVSAHLNTEARERIRALLDAYEQVDGRMKDLVTAFQRDRTAARAEPLVALHGEVAELLDGIAAACPLWDGYPARLRGAVGRIEQGDLDYVAAPLLDSFHTVWHLLHRDMRVVTESW
ncbi:hypothetical protein [Nocardia concava]|uniref:hypothetical protein n=1 Tax=Nocardia concava TaxID=257281 RepID=UPI00030385DA|nr:hypothetical protein [Nocardia concava]